MQGSHVPAQKLALDLNNSDSWEYVFIDPNTQQAANDTAAQGSLEEPRVFFLSLCTKAFGAIPRFRSQSALVGNTRASISFAKEPRLDKTKLFQARLALE